MQLVLNQKALQMFSAVLRNPEGMVARVQGLQQWRAKSETVRRQVIRLQRLLEKGILQDKGKDAQGNQLYDVPEIWEGALPTTYVDVLKEILKHYDAASECVIFTEMYYALADALEGKNPEADTDELIGYKDPAPEAEKKAGGA